MEDQPEVSTDDLVWHYTDAAGLLAILGTDTVWATSSQFLNDRGEVELGQQLAEERMQERAQQEPDGIYGRLGALLRDEKENGPRRDPDGPAGLFPGGARLRRKPWRPVHYDRAAQLRLIDQVLDDRTDTIDRLRQVATDAIQSGAADDLRELLTPEQRDDLDKMFGDLEDVLLLIKHPGFVDEDEVRASFVLWLPDDRANTMRCLRDVIQYRASRYGLAPYLRLTGPGEEPNTPLSAKPCPLPIRAVTVSPSAHGPAAEQSVRDLLAAGGRADVPVTRSGIPFRE